MIKEAEVSASRWHPGRTIEEEEGRSTGRALEKEESTSKGQGRQELSQGPASSEQGDDHVEQNTCRYSSIVT
jgi:hypothetical protein